ncbi:hypothetical protein GOP47_0027731 [Adiantum capillus-veneris]|nr:hypothetical protein GOP47_0027731 [Adiantum capillus-veneris]
MPIFARFLLCSLRAPSCIREASGIASHRRVRKPKSETKRKECHHILTTLSASIFLIISRSQYGACGEGSSHSLPARSVLAPEG